jgi:hypothetical protein
MRGYRSNGCSAATQVKAVSPDIRLSVLGQGVVRSEASIDADAKRRVCIGTGVAGRSGSSNGLHRNLGEPYRSGLTC